MNSSTEASAEASMPTGRWPLSAKALTVALVWTLVMTVCALVGAPRASASIGTAGVDWWAAAQLPPIDSTAPGGARLARDDVAELVCVGDGGVCLASTTRPNLAAGGDPDSDGKYRYVVFDLTGAGGTTTVVAEHVTADTTWAPPGGLLEHGHSYAWAAYGDDSEESPEFSQFVVDLQRYADQPLDPVGPVEIGLGSGAAFFKAGAADTGGEMLSLAYTNLGAPAHPTLPDGWALGGAALDPISFVGVESFGDGETVIAHGIDGTALRYERDETGRYLAPSVNGQDLGFLYPELSTQGAGWLIVDSGGATSTFGADGNLVRVASTAPDGTLQTDVDVVTSRGRILAITDTATGQAVSFGYTDDRSYRPPAGFDRTTADARIGSITSADGTVTNLSYVDGRLARIEVAGATTDLAYDDSGRLVEIRDSLAADAVAAGTRADGASTHWRVAYDSVGRVESVSSPEPTPDAAPLVRSYGYGEVSTTVFDHSETGPVDALTVTFDPNDLRPHSQSSATGATITYLYDADGTLQGWIDSTGQQTSYARDTNTNTVTVYGPAPTAWFDADGVPLPEHAAAVPTQETTTGGGAGMHASFHDDTDLRTPVTAMRLLTSGDITAPGVIDVATGWRVTLTGDPHSTTGTNHYRITADGADANASTVVVNGTACTLGQACAVESDRDGQVMLLVDLHVPAGQGSVSVTVEHSTDGQMWQPVGFDTMTGHDLPTSETANDTYRLGDAPHTSVDETVYADVQLGLEGGYLRDGQRLVAMGYEAADPANDQWARLTSIERPSGLTTTLDYWGAHDYAAHPLTGEMLHQAGNRKTLQMDDGPAYTMIYDNAGRPVATQADGELIEAATYDARGRVERQHVAPSTDNRYIYGADGDPLRTDVDIAIDGEELFISTTVDLLGRTVTHTDPWGVTSTNTYDQLGNLVSTVTVTPNGASTTHTLTWDATGLTGEAIVAIDGTTYSAAVTARDTIGRPTAITYSNGVGLVRSYDPVTGIPTSTWTDSNGDTWTETATGSTQSGRILDHRLDTPTTSARFDYGYDPISGALTDATLSVTGANTLDATWDYLFSYTDSTCPNPGAVLDGARAQMVATIDGTTTTTTTCYDTNGAPVTQTHTSDGTTTDTPIVVADGNIVAYDALTLEYNTLRQLVGAADATTAIHLTRIADGTIIQQTTTTDGAPTTVRYASAGLVLDDNNDPVAQTITLPGDVTITAGDDVTWAYPAIDGDIWWTTTNAGLPVATAPTLYTPDGEPITLAGDSNTDYGWKTSHRAHVLDLDATVVIFGARAYLPALASFTTPDPLAHGGSTPYNYANGDPINLVDTTGFAPESGSWWDNNSWWVELAVIGVMLIASLIPGVGVIVAGVLAILMAGYYTFMAIRAFADGDIYAGIGYTLEAITMVVAWYYMAAKSIAGKTAKTVKTTIVKKSKVTGPQLKPNKANAKKVASIVDRAAKQAHKTAIGSRRFSTAEIRSFTKRYPTGEERLARAAAWAQPGGRAGASAIKWPTLKMWGATMFGQLNGKLFVLGSPDAPAPA